MAQVEKRKLNEFSNLVEEFLRKSYVKKEVLKAASKGKKSLVVDFSVLDQFSPDLADFILSNPRDAFDIFRNGLASIDLSDGSLNVRFSNMPKSSYVKIRDIRSDHIDRLIVVEGQIRTCSDIRPVAKEIIYSCPACANEILVKQEQRKQEAPVQCPGCGRKGSFKILRQILVDTAYIAIEESPEALEGGEQPKRLKAFLEDDLVNPENERDVMPGNKVSLIGILREFPVILRTGGRSTRYDLILEVNNVEPIIREFEALEITPEDEQKILEVSRDKELFRLIIQSVAPTVLGYDRIKEAIMLQVFGGIRKVKADDTTVRGDVHILLIGDPGVGKSMMLTYVNKLAPKSVYVSGKGTSAAGLTATVTRDEITRDWILEAGALVLANRGIAIVDELDKMTHEDRVAMHEAMAQQCFHPDTRVLLSNGTSQSIRGLVEELFEKHKDRVVKGWGCSVLRLNGDVEVFSTDWKSVFPVRVDRVSRHDAFKCFYELESDNGSSVVVTPSHPCFVIHDGKIVERRVEDLSEGDWIAQPSFLPCNPVNQVIKFASGTELGVKKVSFPRVVDERLAFVCGLLLSEGSYEVNRGKRVGINFTNSDKTLVELFNKDMKSLFGITPYIQSRKEDGKVRFFCRYVSKSLTSFFKDVLPGLFLKSEGKFVSDLFMGSSNGAVSALLRGLFEGDGHVSRLNRTIRVGYTSRNRVLCEQIQELLLRFGVASNIRFYGDYSKVCITGYNNIRGFYDNVKFVSRVKNGIIKDYLSSKSGNRTFRDVIPNVQGELLFLLDYFGIKNVFGRRVSGMRYDYLKKRWNVSKEYLKRVLELFRGKSCPPEVRKRIDDLESLAFSQVRWVKVKSVRKVDNSQGLPAYDVTVEPNHTFISHNFVLHNTVTINKANIHATLNAQAGVLAAANPKFGRFDPFTVIHEQINLPPTLINRFDLVFPIRDIPDVKKDELIAKHILETHTNPLESTNALDKEFLRKYVAYAKQHSRPVLTSQANAEIMKFYVKLRNKKSLDPDKLQPIPISARQLESLIRLAEASARIRLSDKVSKQDALRAIDLLRFSMEQVGVDPETGEMDIDRLITGIPSAQRNKIYTMKSILKQLEEDVGENIPVDSIIESAKVQGISEEKADELLGKMTREGEIYSPRHGIVKRMK